MYRSSIERHNAPYRGVTSRSDAVNFDLAVIHDMIDIQKRSGGHPSFKGHKDFIQNNLSALYTGETNVYTDTPTAGSIVHIKEPVEGIQDLTTWNALNGATLTKNPLGYTAKTSGNLSQSGFERVIQLNAGDTIQFRLKLTAKAYDQTLFAIGALNLEGEDVLDIISLEDFEDGRYLIHRVHSTSTQDVRLVLYIAYETISGSPVELDVDDFSIDYINEAPVYIRSLEEELKTDLEVQKQTLVYLEEELKI